jgi:hypothetical protein
LAAVFTGIVVLNATVTAEVRGTTAWGLGLKLATVTGSSTVKTVAEVAEPLGLVRRNRPVVAPAGTRTKSCDAVTTLKSGAATPLKVTLFVPIKSVPVMSTSAPGKSLLGVKLMRAGGATRWFR